MANVVDIPKTVYDLAMKGKTLELQEQVMQLREEALQLQEENLRLKTENLAPTACQRRRFPHSRHSRTRRNT